MKKLLFLVLGIILCSLVYADEVIQRDGYTITVVEKPFSETIDDYENHPREVYYDAEAKEYIDSLNVGIFLDSLKLNFVPAVEKAHELGVDCIELSTVKDLDILKPLSDAQVKMILDTCKKNNIKISSLCAEVGGLDIANKKELAKRVEAVKVCADNAALLGCDIIQFHFGGVAFDKNDPRYVKMKTGEAKAGYSKDNLVKAIKELDAYCYAKGIKIAQETGASSGYILRDFIEKNGLKATFINFDPANMVMYGRDEIESLKELKGMVIQVHVKDGLRESFKAGFTETPLGGGDVKWNEFFHTLKAIGFNGNLIIERECGTSPVEDIAIAVEFLK